MTVKETLVKWKALNHKDKLSISSASIMLGLKDIVSDSNEDLWKDLYPHHRVVVYSVDDGYIGLTDFNKPGIEVKIFEAEKHTTINEVFSEKWSRKETMTRTLWQIRKLLVENNAMSSRIIIKEGDREIVVNGKDLMLGVSGDKFTITIK